MELFSKNANIEYDAVINVLLKHITHESRDTRMAVLKWISHMHATASVQVNDLSAHLMRKTTGLKKM